MAIIQADTPEIERELRKLEQLVEQGGGGLHSDVILYSNKHGLGIKTKEPMARGKEILRLSRDTLLPDDCYHVGLKDGHFTLEFPENSPFSPLQKDLAACMIALYNLTDKVGLQKNISFLLSLIEYPELLDYLAAGRPFNHTLSDWREKLETHGTQGPVFDEFITQTFLKTRHLGYSDKIRASTVSILMPVVDFMNHHWQGAAFNVGLGVRPGDLAVMSSQPVEESTDCYAFYGIMDSFDTLVRYDFIDEFAPVVRSIPLELDVPGMGTIKIDSQTGAMNKKKLEQPLADLTRFIPIMRLNEEKTVLSASHIMIPTGGSPRALRRILYILLTNLTRKEVEESLWKPWVEKAESEVLEKNIAYYKGMAALTDKHIEKHGTNPHLERINHLAQLQLEKLERYTFPASKAA